MSDMCSYCGALREEYCGVLPGSVVAADCGQFRNLLPKAKYWMGDPGPCDFTSEGGEHPMLTFIDGRTTMGPWANMCLGCARKYGVGLGQGDGQEYKIQEDGRWLKTGG